MGVVVSSLTEPRDEIFTTHYVEFLGPYAPERLEG